MGMALKFQNIQWYSFVKTGQSVNIATCGTMNCGLSPSVCD